MNTTYETARVTPALRVQMAARRLYDAECALHAAHQTHVDAWINAAGDKLHQAIVEHLAAVGQLAAAPCRNAAAGDGEGQAARVA